MKMVEVKTAELAGPALDWAVAEAIGHKPHTGNGCAHAVEIIDWNRPGSLVNGRRFEPSTDWRQGGPLFDLYDILLGGLTGKPYAVVNKFPNGCGVRQNGPTKLISACRAIVAAKLGDTVRVPAALVGGEA